MIKRPLICLLAGTREVQDVSGWLAEIGADCVVLWARGSTPVPLGMPEVADVPDDVAGILDVTHAFDDRTRQVAMMLAPKAAFACVVRDLWTPDAGDAWTQVDTLDQALTTLPGGARVFAATGRNSLGILMAHDGQIYLRQLSRHNDPTGYENCTFVFGTAPFSVQEEVALLQKLKIDTVLARNIGGAGSFPKLAAARALGLPVVLLRPPARPKGPNLRTAQDVADWVATL